MSTINEPVKISDSEWEVMRVIWNNDQSMLRQLMNF